MTTTTQPAIRSRARGFAAMDQGKQREIARRGGRAAHAQGTAHKFSSEEARRAGRKGGEAVSGNREYMARIGRRGGEARHALRKAQNAAAAAVTNDGSQMATPEAQLNNTPAANDSGERETSQTQGNETGQH